MQTFIARQPVLNRQKQVHAYEFLYRPHVEDGSEPDPHRESFHIISDVCALLNMGQLTLGKKVFVKAAPDLLLNSHLQKLPIETTVIEISSVTEPTPVRGFEEIRLWFGLERSFGPRGITAPS